MSHVHRHSVIASLDAIKNEDVGFSPIAWTCEYGVEDNMPTSFTLVNNQSVSIPLSKKDLKMLEDVAERAEIGNWQLEWHIKGTEILEIYPSKFQPFLQSGLIASALERLEQSNIDPSDVEASLSHLALCRAVETADDVDYDGEQNMSRSARCDMNSYPGSFATLVLQVPVIGGHRGGEFRLHNRTERSEIFATSRNSHRSYHMTVFYDDCQESIEPITKGARLDFVFNLHHKKAPKVSSQPVLDDDLKSPLYRIFQPPLPPLTDEDIAELTKKQAIFRNLFSCWNKLNRNRLELFVIPLDHSYGNNLTFDSLKGIDRSTAKLVTSLLGDIVEIHLVTAKKYIGYKEEDWIASGREIIKKKTEGRQILESDWSEHWIGNWIDRQGRRLLLSPISFNVPDDLLGLDEMVFQPDPSQELVAGKYDGYTYERTAMVIWPRNQTFLYSLIFGLDQSLDVVEAGLETNPVYRMNEPAKNQMRHLLALCKREPNKSWYANTTECSDLRCDRARVVSHKVASERALRLINLCIRWNLPDSGLELLRVLFSNIEQSDYRCHKCTYSNDGVIFVGGICSNAVADALSKLVVLLGWGSIDVQNCIKRFIANNRTMNLKQTGQLAFFASCLFIRQCFAAAMFVADQVFQLLVDYYLKESVESRANEKVIAIVIDMLLLIDGAPFSESSRLCQLLSQLKSLSTEHLSVVIGWLQLSDANVLKSIPLYLEFYMDLVTNLETQMYSIDSPSFKRLPSLTRLEKDSAQLMTSYLKLEDQTLFNTLIDRLTQTNTIETRNMLSAIVSSRWIWAVPSTPKIEAALHELCAARAQQLFKYKFPRFKWVQPDAVLKEHPDVEAFLHAGQESMTYSNFTSEEAAQEFANQWFGQSSSPNGYSATIVEIGRNAEGLVFVTIRKAPEIYEYSLKQLEVLEGILNFPESSPVNKLASPPSGSLTPEVPSSSTGSPTPEVIPSTPDSGPVKTYRGKINCESAKPAKKRSRRTAKLNESVA